MAGILMPINTVLTARWLLSEDFTNQLASCLNGMSAVLERAAKLIRSIGLRRSTMRTDYMCNSCGLEFSENVKDKNAVLSRCPDCKSTDIYEIPICMPEEGYQSWSAENYS